MNDDYLWDRSGGPDPEIVRLEELLGGARHRAPLRIPSSSTRDAWGSVASGLGALAALVFAALGTWFATLPPDPGRGATHRLATPLPTPQADREEGSRGPSEPTALPPGGSWEVARVEGSPRVGSSQVATNARLGVGEWLETDASSKATISVGDIGEVEVEPRTRISLLDAGVASHRISLARGVMHAKIWAPPGSFFVETPSSVAVDLGCAYTLEVNDEGVGIVKVTSGWVGFEYKGRESFIPKGARCVTRPGLGPGTPYFEDASPRLREGLDRLDSGSTDRPMALAAVLGEARRKDALTLWHLLPRMAGEDRLRVYERMAVLLPPPPGVTREGILRGDRQMLDLWWNTLGLESAEWWRLWKSAPPPERSPGSPTRGGGADPSKAVEPKPRGGEGAS